MIMRIEFTNKSIGYYSTDQGATKVDLASWIENRESFIVDSTDNTGFDGEVTGYSVLINSNNVVTITFPKEL